VHRLALCCPGLLTGQCKIKSCPLNPQPIGFEEQQVLQYDCANRTLLGEQGYIAGPKLSTNFGGFRNTFPETAYHAVRQNAVLKNLEVAYVFDDRAIIPMFINRNRLLGHLLMAREPLISAFGEAAVKKLTLVEDDEGFVTLFCLILFPGGLEDARRALNLFDEMWWLAKSGQVAGKLNFDFELI